MFSLGWTEVDIAEVDIDNAAAAALAITLNRTAELAEWNDETLDSILREIDTGDEYLQQMLADLYDEIGLAAVEGEAVELKQLDVKTPPKMTWALIGIPTVRFGEIASAIEQLAEVDGLILETTSNDG